MCSHAVSLAPVGRHRSIVSQRPRHGKPAHCPRTRSGRHENVRRGISLPFGDGLGRVGAEPGSSGGTGAEYDGPHGPIPCHAVDSRGHNCQCDTEREEQLGERREHGCDPCWDFVQPSVHALVPTRRPGSHQERSSGEEDRAGYDEEPCSPIRDGSDVVSTIAAATVPVTAEGSHYRLVGHWRSNRAPTMSPTAPPKSEPTIASPLVFEILPHALRVRIPRSAVGLSPAARALHLASMDAVMALGSIASGKYAFDS